MSELGAKVVADVGLVPGGGLGRQLPDSDACGNDVQPPFEPRGERQISGVGITSSAMLGDDAGEFFNRVDLAGEPTDPFLPPSFLLDDGIAAVGASVWCVAVDHPPATRAFAPAVRSELVPTRGTLAELLLAVFDHNLPASAALLHVPADITPSTSQ